ncbi:hypothetical protein OBP_295 [Pseudomonas phage OBP]|uniref:hypothetical protein n=1 Tax=Pseudomonas phage OBP TaxID=1124849 RepID=UPI000240D642|nr:hypothetical protein OBP_295 [Pseudomonas phage OBP]AEV89732.1 hypothetical protein OBP_295 [Pseudomonas phage OBP]
MTKLNKGFGKIMDARVEDLVKNAEVHKDTHHISFKVPTALSEKKDISFGSEVEVLTHAVDLINGYGLAVEAATTQIAHEQFPETKQETWDGRLGLFDGLTMNSDIRLREVVGEDTLFGTTQTFIDHPHSQDMVNWYSNFQEVNADRAKKLFD